MITKVIGLFLLVILFFGIGYVVGRTAHERKVRNRSDDKRWLDEINERRFDL